MYNFELKLEYLRHSLLNLFFSLVKLQVMKDLRKQLKDAQKDVREMKLLLDMFKTLPKEQRDKAQLMAAEKKVSSSFIQQMALASRPFQFEPKNTVIGLSVVPFYPGFFCQSCS